MIHRVGAPAPTGRAPCSVSWVLAGFAMIGTGSITGPRANCPAGQSIRRDGPVNRLVP